MYGNCVLGVPAAFLVETLSGCFGIIWLYHDFIGIFSVIFCPVHSFEDLGRKHGTGKHSGKPCSHLCIAKNYMTENVVES